MSTTLDAILDQAIDNYAVTAILSPEIVAVLLYALSQIENPDSWLDTTENPLDEITDTDRDEIEELIAGANMSIITPEVGFIRPYVTTNLPTNTIACDGGTYNRADYPLLYAVIDSAFIIDADTFHTPNLEGRVIIGVGTNNGFTYGTGDVGGSEEITLTENQMPAHNHTIPQIVGAPTQEGIGISRNITVPIVSDVTGTTGGSQAHENRQPFIALKYCVVAR